MKTLTVTQARTGLGKLCEQVKNGEEVGIISGDQIFQLLPVKVKPVVPGEITIIPMTDEYVWNEYDVTSEEFQAFKKRQTLEYTKGKHAGTVKRFSGNLEEDIQD